MAELITLYDEFVSVQGRCAFFCDAFNALAAHQQWEPHSQRGLSFHSNQLKDDMEQFRLRLLDLLNHFETEPGRLQD